MPVSRVIATLRRPGFHFWPDAPETAEHLRGRHRHLFTFRVECPVRHHDRDIEFHELMFKLEIALLDDFKASRHGLEFGAMSCEMIGTAIGRRLSGYGFDVTAVEVWEDDEHGARVEWP